MIFLLRFCLLSGQTLLKSGSLNNIGESLIILIEVIFLIRKKGENRIIFLAACFFLMFTVLVMRYFVISQEQKNVRAAELRSEFTINAGTSQGTIYDRNLQPIVNAEKSFNAVVIPTAADKEKTAEYAVDRTEFLKKYEKGEPFIFECRSDTPETDGLTVFELPVRYSENQPACHTVGYLSENSGADGIEYAYDSILRCGNGENTVSYQVDGFGRVMIGDGKKVTRSSAAKSGVVTTLDLDMQKICEEYGKKIKKGAIVLADVKNGDILAMASFPNYSFSQLDKAFSDKNCPLINRNLYSYSVGSIFKLVVSAEAIEEGMEGMMYDCSGNIDIQGQLFNCHKYDGHGLQALGDALTNSCNTYFINLVQALNTEKLRYMAYSLGFGRENQLCAGIIGSAGRLPSVSELTVPAELANFAFGQGRLTATPLQITQLACSVANGGKMPELRLIKGLTTDGENVLDRKEPRFSQVMEKETAEKLRKMMVLAVRNNKNSNAKSKKVSVGAKTSTAQTGIYKSNGDEICNAWITGFFPSRKPEYALTVLVEDGGYGNDSAAPIFRKIAEKITDKQKKT